MKTFVLNGWAASEAAWQLCTFSRERIFSYTEQLSGLPEKIIDETDDDILLVGWSMGGSGALRMFLREPKKIRAMVLIAATARMMRDDGWVGMSPRRLEALKRGLLLTRGQGFFGVQEGRPNPYMLDSDANLDEGLRYLVETDLRADLLSSPYRNNIEVRIVQSNRDGIVSSANAEFLKTVFSRAKVTMVESMEHALPIFVPELIDDAVNELMGGK